jgi:hypothetical protein
MSMLSTLRKLNFKPPEEKFLDMDTQTLVSLGQAPKTQIKEEEER